MKNCKNIQEFSRTTRCFSRIKDKTRFDSKLRTGLGAQGRLATLMVTDRDAGEAVGQESVKRVGGNRSL